MKGSGFLHTVAQKIFEKEKDNLQNVMVLFPNQRAIRFFFEYLKDNARNSVTPNDKDNSVFFVPKIFSIDQMVGDYLGDMRKGDNLELLYLLYTVYCDVFRKNLQTQDDYTIESFDEFYFWGSVILKDFDQIDKELVNAEALFRNLQDYKDLEIDPKEYLNSQQIELINRLFNSNIDNDESSMRKNFVKVWNNLYEIYQQFNVLLDKHNLAYSGKMYREFARRLEQGEITLNCEKIKIIGFSVLNKVEKKIFRLLKEQYTTDFYWDYDNYYAKNDKNEAGIFIRENIVLFPQSNDLKDVSFDNIANKKQKINIISSPYETTSLAYIGMWLKEVVTSKSVLNTTAIVLNDESLIPLVIKSLPADYKGKINITMGYPFNQTWLYNELLADLYALVDKGEFSKQKVFDTIKHIVDSFTDKQKDGLWQVAILKKISEMLLSFIDMLDKIKDVKIGGDIIKNVLKKELSAFSLDIISDGIDGVQLMGMLETRSLDFENVLMLSTDDDNLPKLSREVSFIPYSFRKAYDMGSMERKSGVFAYYFYRLLQHTKRVDYIYTTIGGENKLKEKSRFLRQIEIEFPAIGEKKQINYKSLTAVKALRPENREYFFDINELKFLDKGDKRLSPSSLNNLIHCQQKFYLKNVRYLSETIDDDDYLAIAFGNVFHNSINLFYEDIKGKNIGVEDAMPYIENAVDKYINSDAAEQDKRVCSDAIHLNMIKKYMKQVYRKDFENNVEYIGGEKEYKRDLNVGGYTVHLFGRLDRIDRVEDSNYGHVVRIVDYKTGAAKERNFNTFEQLMQCPNEGQKSRKNGFENIFEILFYCYLAYNNGEADVIKPELLYLSNLDDRDITMSESRSRNKNVFYYDKNTNEAFEKSLKTMLGDFLSKQQGEKYEAIINEDKCRYCDYYILCRMGKKQDDNDTI